MIDKFCCDKKMIIIPNIDFMSQNTNNCDRYICGECGTIIDETEYTLDEEEWINEAQNFEEMKETNYYKEIMPLCKDCKDLDIIDCSKEATKGICYYCGKNIGDEKQ